MGEVGSEQVDYGNAQGVEEVAEMLMDGPEILTENLEILIETPEIPMVSGVWAGGW
jgi:hypothetical protein